jgi:hypothetical protein
MVVHAWYMLTDIQKGGRFMFVLALRRRREYWKRCEMLFVPPGRKPGREEPQRNKMMVGLGKMLE